jgi:hypothetical protein
MGPFRVKLLKYAGVVVGCGVEAYFFVFFRKTGEKNSQKNKNE